VNFGGQCVDVQGFQPAAQNKIGGSGVNAVGGNRAAIATNEPIVSNHRFEPPVIRDNQSSQI
jgi:hypothetical protein